MRVGLPGDGGGCDAQDEASDGEETEGAHLDLGSFPGGNKGNNKVCKTCRLGLYWKYLYKVGNDSERNRDHDIGTYEADYLYIFSRGIET